MAFVLYEQVLDNLPDGITIQDKNFRIMYQNKTMIKTFGNHLGEKCYSIYERRDAMCEGCGIRKAFKSGESVMVLRTAIETDGSISYWENSCFPLFDINRNIVAGVEVCRNISDRVSLEEEVKERNVQLGQVNNQVIKKAAELAAMLKERKLAEENLKNEIEQRKQVESKLRESEEKYRIQFENMLDAVLVTDVETGVLVDCNSAALRLLGKDYPEVVGHSQKDFYPSEDAYQKFLKTFHGKKEEIIETEIVTKTGEQIDVAVKANIFEHQGKKLMQGIFRDVTEKKKSEKERAFLEAQLAHTQKLESIGYLAAGIAHEINTPAQFVGDNIRFLKEGFSDVLALIFKYNQLAEICTNNGIASEMIHEIETAAKAMDFKYLLGEIPRAIDESMDGVNRVSNIVRSMKEFSHPPEKEKTPSDLNKAIENTITICRNEWKNVAEMVMDFDPDLPPVPCFLDELNQVILNLIMNSIYAIKQVEKEKLGKIVIATRYEKSWVEIRVADTGAGISEEHKGKIFSQFFTTKEVGQGTGQGLAISYSIITKKHGGTIDFQSEAGKGTTFIIRLPAQ